MFKNRTIDWSKLGKTLVVIDAANLEHSVKKIKKPVFCNGQLITWIAPGKTKYIIFKCFVKLFCNAGLENPQQGDIHWGLRKEDCIVAA